MFTKKSIKLFSVSLCIIAMTCVVAVSTGFTNSINLNSNDISSLLPQKEEIQKKVNFDKLINIKQNGKSEESINFDIENYIDSLADKALLLTIAECAEELEKNNSMSEMGMFAKNVDKKLISKMRLPDYVNIVNSHEYSTGFKTFMINTVSYSDCKKYGKNSEDLNNALKDMVKKDDLNEDILSYALQTIDEYDENDLRMLKSILDSTKSSPKYKTIALDKLKYVDMKESVKYADNVLENPSSFTEIEQKKAMYVLSYVSKRDHNMQTKANLIKFAKENLEGGDNSNIIKTSIYSLGEMKDEEALKLLAQNRDKINNDSQLEFVADINYTVIIKMLEPSNEKETIIAALTFCDIAPFNEYYAALNELKDNIDEEIKVFAQKAMKKTTTTSFKRNTKWDEYK